MRERHIDVCSQYLAAGIWGLASEADQMWELTFDTSLKIRSRAQTGFEGP